MSSRATTEPLQPGTSHWSVGLRPHITFALPSGSSTNRHCISNIFHLQNNQFDPSTSHSTWRVDANFLKSGVSETAIVTESSRARLQKRTTHPGQVCSLKARSPPGQTTLGMVNPSDDNVYQEQREKELERVRLYGRAVVKPGVVELTGYSVETGVWGAVEPKVRLRTRF